MNDHVRCYLDASDSNQNGAIKQALKSAGLWDNTAEIAVRNGDGNPSVANDTIPFLAVHRTWWEVTDTTAEQRKRALNQYCKSRNRWTLLVAFTGGWDGYPGDEEWRKRYAGADFPAERLCVLLDTDFVEAIPIMANYLRSTPLTEWRSDGFWQGPVLPKHLTSLSLLCEEFLAVQCGPDGQAKDGFTVEVPDTRGKIVDALRKMKWGEFIVSEGLKYNLDQWPSVADRTGRDALRIEVSSHEFWDVFDETETKKLAKAIDSEWEALCGGKKFGDSCTHRLIEALPLKAGARVGGDFPTLVAEIYIELAARLGRTE